MNEAEVTLEQMLIAREKRVLQQQEFLCPGMTIVSFSMSIAGPIKNSPLILRGFEEGLLRLKETIHHAKISCLREKTVCEVTGNEALLLLDTDPIKAKRLAVEIEDEDALGRLFDIDVLSDSGRHISRKDIGLEERKCLICNLPGHGCASRRTHSVEQLRHRTHEILKTFFLKKDLDWISSNATRALAYEVCVTPKPGLVDRDNNGSHADMDLFLFIDSLTQLSPFFRECMAIGEKTKQEPPPETFQQLRKVGKHAECEMFRVTKGINTHKGAIFSMGTVCGAIGRLYSDEGLCRDVNRILREVAIMTQDAMHSDFSSKQIVKPTTQGESLYIQYGLMGIRGEVMQGLPAVSQVGLPWLRKALSKGKSIDEAGVIALLHLIATVSDTNMIARSNYQTQKEVARQLQKMLDKDPMPSVEQGKLLNQEFVSRNLSPGGCADLLAIAFFLLFLENKQ